MSDANTKTRWPWVLVAILGLSGALLLPLRSMRLATAPVPNRQALRPAPTLKLERQAQRSVAGHGGAGRATQGDTPAIGPVAAGPLGPPPDPAAANDDHGSQGERRPDTLSPDGLRNELQRPGRFGLAVPSKMEVGRSEHVTLIAAIDKLRPLVTTELQTASEGQPTAALATKDLPLSRLLRVELRGDSEADFEIRPFTPAEQRLSDQQVTTWEWSLTAKSDGDKHLTVVISNLVDAQGLPIAVSIAHRTVQVSQTVIQQIREVSGLASSAASALAGLVGTWLGLLKPLLQKRREEESKGAVKPDGKSGDGKSGDGKSGEEKSGEEKSGEGKSSEGKS